MTFDDLRQADFKFPTVALFYGSACRPCDMLKPKLREVCKEEGVRLEEFNSANEFPAIRDLGLRSVPAVVVVHGGAIKLAFIGNATGQEIKEKLRAAGVSIR